MTKDADGVFKNPQHEPLKIAGVTKSDTSGNMTKDQIMSIKDGIHTKKRMSPLAWSLRILIFQTH